MRIQLSILALTVLVATAWAQNCPSRFNYHYGTSKYFVSRIRYNLSHSAAERACWSTARNAYLADVNEKYEHNFLKNLANRHGCDAVWLGGFRYHGTSWNWLWKKRRNANPYEIHMGYQKWGPREPNNYKRTNENRMVLYKPKDYNFADVPQRIIPKYVRGDMNNRLCYICECPLK